MLFICELKVSTCIFLTCNGQTGTPATRVNLGAMNRTNQATKVFAKADQLFVNTNSIIPMGSLAGGIP